MLRADLAGEYLLAGLIIERIIRISIYRSEQIVDEKLKVGSRKLVRSRLQQIFRD